MTFSLFILLIFVVVIGIYSFLLLSLNDFLIQLDLLFFKVDLSLGFLLIASFLLGIAVAVFLEIIYFSSRTKKDE